MRVSETVNQNMSKQLLLDEGYFIAASLSSDSPILQTLTFKKGYETCYTENVCQTGEIIKPF